mgnify:CR=1 FL=1
MEEFYFKEIIIPIFNKDYLFEVSGEYTPEQASTNDQEHIQEHFELNQLYCHKLDQQFYNDLLTDTYICDSIIEQLIRLKKDK